VRTTASEQLEPEERRVLARYVTDLDGNVFALTNLPEEVKGALFARYSRSTKGLRRLLLDEFLDGPGAAGGAGEDGPGAAVGSAGRERAEQFYARVLDEYGDDSIAQLGGVHVACEQVSNLLTKVLERPRLMSYLEQSTRYVPYDTRDASGRYRYYRDPDVLDSPLGARYVAEMDAMFDAYSELLPLVVAHLARALPRDPVVTEIAWRRSVRARALDALRGLLPAGACSNVGIFGSGQAFEALVLRLRVHPLPEARRVGEAILREIRKVTPAFLRRVDLPERGGEWSAYLARCREETATAVAETLGSAHGGAPLHGPLPAEVDLVDFDPDGEDKVLAAIAYPHARRPERELLAAVRRLDPAGRARLFEAYVGDRRNRRHRPGRAFERTSYRFDVVSDYGAFRDLQRHRLLTVEWQPLGTSLGYALPEDVVEAGVARRYEECLERSAALHEALAQRFPAQAGYAVALAFRVRYALQLNAREAMHVIELRSAPQGHPSYRQVVQEMHRLIAERAGHRALAAAMRFADHGGATLGRLASEQRRADRIPRADGEGPLLRHLDGEAVRRA
jgi:thymidylate synthase ThyX